MEMQMQYIAVDCIIPMGGISPPDKWYDVVRGLPYYGPTSMPS
jgi:hypothetical protein